MSAGKTRTSSTNKTKTGKMGSKRSRSKWAHLLDKYLVHNPDIAWQVIEDETVVVIPGPEPVMHVLNETATFIWQKAEPGEKTVAEIIDMLMDEYDVGPIRARRDVCELVDELTQAGVVVLREEPGALPATWE